jgi:hypothetical protein
MTRATNEAVTDPLPDDVGAFGKHLASILASELEDSLVGVYYVGSVALGGYVSGHSDIDIVAVCHQGLTRDAKRALAQKLVDASVDCPTRGLEFTLYRGHIAAAAAKGADFELNVNGGVGMRRLVRLTSTDQPRFWYVLDRAIAHRHGLAISGARPAQVFAPVPRPLLLDVLGESMRWHREHERATLYSVLNATRAWRFAVDDILGSKLEGAQWARKRWAAPWLIDAAVELRHGRVALLDGVEVDRLLAHVEGVLTEATESRATDHD